MAVEKPNYTQTPNKFIDEYMSQVSPHASMVYFVICRKTIGWHKDTDSISIQQIVSITGLSKDSVLRGIKQLEEFKLIKVERSGKGRRAVNTYELNFESVSESEKPMDNSPAGKENSSYEQPKGEGENTNGSCERPINPVNGSCERPINPVNGSCERHTKEIVLNKDSKEKDTPLADQVTGEFKGEVVKHKKNSPDGGTTFHTVANIFYEGSKKLISDKFETKPFKMNGQQGSAIKELESIYNANPESFINLARKFYVIKQHAPENEFLRKLAFKPSTFLFFYDDIAQYEFSTVVKDRVIRTTQTDEERLIDEYGSLDERKLKYLVGVKHLTEAEYDYILKHRLEATA